MPPQFKVPGVMVAEVSSAKRPIEGMPTSVTAFVGRAARGPVNQPVAVANFGEYERRFGGLSADSAMSYAVDDFFRNGGNRALIVRLFRPDTSPNDRSRARIDLDGMELEAANEGAWGNGLLVVVSDDIDAAVATQLGVAPGELFNIAVYERRSGVADADLVALEVHRNLTLSAGPNEIAALLSASSERLRAVSNGVSAPRPGTYSVQADAEAGDGVALNGTDYVGGPRQAEGTGLYALDTTDVFNLLCLPPDFSPNDTYPGTLAADAILYCQSRSAIFLYDPPAAWTDASTALQGINNIQRSRHTALYFPRVIGTNPLNDNRPHTRVPCGVVAGVIARTDSARGVWKAPAGRQATLNGIAGLATDVSRADMGELTRHGVNCLASKPPMGTLVWGARTLAGDARQPGEWRYVSVVRTMLFLKESLERGLGWVVFEPNDERLWARIRQAVEAFMDAQFRAGALQGRSRDEAYFVQCDRSTMSATDLLEGRVIVVVGFSLMKPAMFQILNLQLQVDPDA